MKRVTKPQFPEDQPQAVAGTAPYRGHCIDKGTSEPVPIEFVIRLHATDGKLDRAAPWHHCVMPRLQARAVNLHAVDWYALVTAIHDCHIRDAITQVCAKTRPRKTTPCPFSEFAVG